MTALDQVLRYHIATKHHFNSFARGPTGLDWANQPDPFRQYVGAPMFMLDRNGELESFKTPLTLNLKGVSHLFFHRLALSAWKSIIGSTWLTFPRRYRFFLLPQGDLRLMARQSSCHQHIASDGCFTVAMLAEFEEALQEFGPWLYSRLYWECGMIGQMLYLGEEANRLSGCGIGLLFR